MENRLERALQIAMLLDDSKRLGKALKIAQEIAHTRLDAGEVVTWKRMFILLARYSENDKLGFVEQICQQATELERKGDFVFAARLKEDALKLFVANKQHEQARKLRLELAETLVASAEQEVCSGSGEDWRTYRRAQSHIEKAISHLNKDKASGTKQRLEELYVLLTEYSKKRDENMEWKELKVELPRENQDELNAMGKDVAESLEGKPLEEALMMLAVGLQPIDVDAFREEADRRGGGLASLVDSRVVNHAGKTVGRGEPFSVGWYASICRQIYVTSMIQPAIDQITKEHDVKLEDIVMLLEECDFVPQDSKWTFSYGIMAGLKFDLVAVAHVLPPMLENAFREMLAFMGENTANWDSEYISKERSLTWVLKQPKLEQAFGTKLLIDLKNLLLNYEGGFNLRNEVSHGLMGDAGFFRDAKGRNNQELAQVIYLWWLALRLCLSSRE